MLHSTAVPPALSKTGPRKAGRAGRPFPTRSRTPAIRRRSPQRRPKQDSPWPHRKHSIGSLRDSGRRPSEGPRIPRKNRGGSQQGTVDCRQYSGEKGQNKEHGQFSPKSDASCGSTLDRESSGKRTAAAKPNRTGMVPRSRYKLPAHRHAAVPPLRSRCKDPLHHILGGDIAERPGTQNPQPSCRRREALCGNGFGARSTCYKALRPPFHPGRASQSRSGPVPSKPLERHR